jgi:hypothetical protein
MAVRMRTCLIVTVSESEKNKAPYFKPSSDVVGFEISLSCNICPMPIN